MCFSVPLFPNQLRNTQTRDYCWVWNHKPFEEIAFPIRILLSVRHSVCDTYLHAFRWWKENFLKCWMEKQPTAKRYPNISRNEIWKPKHTCRRYRSSPSPCRYVDSSTVNLLIVWIIIIGLVMLRKAKRTLNATGKHIGKVFLSVDVCIYCASITILVLQGASWEIPRAKFECSLPCRRRER